MKCGLCVGHCPTYQRSQDEGESPRGRIALIQALAGSVLDASPRMTTHLESCLECQACETVCPSEVRFSALMDGARAMLHERRPWWKQRCWQGLLWVLSHRHLLRRGATVLKWVGRLGPLRKALLGSLKLLRVPGAELAAELGPGGMMTPDRELNSESTNKKVQLFLGCVTSIADAGAINATIRLLPRLGYEVEVPPDQTCCGAMHLHNGLAEQAAGRAADNLRAFEDPSAAPILSVASGCANTLRAAGEISAAESESGAAFGSRVRDVSDFLSELDWPSSLRLLPLDETILVHDPCSLRNGLRRSSSVYRLVSRIPGARIEPLDGNDRCCGAAGTYLLTHPEMSKHLLARKLDALRKQDAKILLTSNTGCALHLKAGIRAAGLGVEVLHPVELVERHLGAGVDATTY